jgi:hypothetical protein
MANRRFQAWWPMGKHFVQWPMKGSKLDGQWGSILFDGQWKVPNLVVNGETFLLSGPWKESNAWMPLEKEGETSFSHFFTFHPIKFYLNFFSFDFVVLRYHGSRSLLRIFPSFSLTYKLQSHIAMYQIFHTFNAKLISTGNFFPWIHGVAHDYVL